MSVKSFKTSGVGVDLAPQGLVLINTTSFSGVASQSVNDVFSATYDNYRIIFSDIVLGTGTALLTFRLRVSGSDASGTDYAVNFINRTDSSLGSGQNANQTGIVFGVIGTLKSYFEMSVSSPFKTDKTGFLFSGVSLYSDSVSQTFATAGCSHDLSTSYTGISIIPASSNISGTISVYGVNK